MIENYDPMNLSDPFEFYKWARQNSPIFHDVRSDYWVLTKHKHIHHVLSNENLFSAELEPGQLLRDGTRGAGDP